MFRKMPLILLAMIILAVLSYPWMPLEFKAILYGLSLSLKSCIIFVLPLIIFGLLFKTAAQLAKKATKWIIFILSAICLSNFISTMISYGVGTLAYQFDLSMTLPTESNSLQPLGVIALPKWIDNSMAMFSGLILGILCGWFLPSTAEKVSRIFETIVGNILKVFLYVIPLFIVGFVVKMLHDGTLSLIVRNYSIIFILVACAVFSYIALIYLAISRFQGKAFVKSLKNMLPAAIAGFGSMSSAAAMPLTLLGTEKNADYPDKARSIIPVTVNIHLIGDCFAIPIFAFAILKSFGIAEPSFISYLIFALYFVMAKFSVAAVPGGGILVMLPILETYLGFNGEMLSLITALYILFDPLITSANVMGNGGFAMGLSKKR